MSKVTQDELNAPHPPTRIPVVVSFDNNFVTPGITCLYSMLKHADPAHFYEFTILHSDITEANQNRFRKLFDLFSHAQVEFIGMAHLFKDVWSNKRSGYTKEVIYKIKAASLFPQHSRVIFTDVDVLYLRDFSKSYFVNLDGFYCAGIKPVGKLKSYYQSMYRKFGKDQIAKFETMGGGYVVFNLDQIRQDQIEPVMVDYLKKNVSQLVQLEQDVLNYCFDGKVRQLPLEYMVCSYFYDRYRSPRDFETDLAYSKDELTVALQDPIHLHYAGFNHKPWTKKCAKDDLWHKARAEAFSMIGES